MELNRRDFLKGSLAFGGVAALGGLAGCATPQQASNDSAKDAALLGSLGGNDAEIVLIGREAGSGTRDGFESITDTKDACQYRQELTSTGGVIEAVAGNPNAIGYASLSAVEGKIGRAHV